MSAFKGAVEVGAHAIETDIHVTKDGVVVLSHVGAGTSIGL
jgi:glycerophosphoryl diester phosphodiesterase